MSKTRRLIIATRASSNQIHCRMELHPFAAQLEGTSFRLASSADPATTKLSFQRSIRRAVTPRSWLTVSTDSPFRRRNTALVFS